MKRGENHISLFLIAAVAFMACRSTEKPAWNTGIALYSFNQSPFVTAIDKADSAGVKYVEGFSFHNLGKEFSDSTMANISTEDMGKMKKLLADKGIQMPSIYAGGASDANGWKVFFEIGKGLGISYLVCEPEKAHWDMLDSLAAVYNIKIAIHQHAKGQSAYWHPDSVLAALKEHPNFGACADLGHWARSGLDPVICLQQLKGHILGIHLKDIDTLGNPKANDVNVGTGIIRFKDIVDELKHQEYKGMVFLECEHNWQNNLSDIKRSLRYFEELAGTAN